MIYYTYAYLREDRTPYYIGKGKGNRVYRRRKTDIKPPKDKSRILILKKNLTEEEAFKHEIYMIAVFGRKDLGTGILHNRTDGGEGMSGFIFSEESKRKISEANKNPSKETRKKMSEAQKGKIPWNKGKPHSQESKRKMSEARKGKGKRKKGIVVSKETKEKLSKVNVKYNYKIYSIKESKIYETNNLNAFCKENSLNHSPLFGTITGKRKQHKGFVLVEKVEIQHQQS
jgi:hypothetical protein